MQTSSDLWEGLGLINVRLSVPNPTQVLSTLEPALVTQDNLETIAGCLAAVMSHSGEY